MSLFTKKSIAELRAEADAGTLRRSLGPLSLTALGIGSIIGTGIFVLTGTAASQYAGPALVLSMVIAAVGCAFAGLCYAEFAAMIPVSGSAYTYAYATMGELMAWIIGWDLVLEYALSAATVAVGWSGYAASLLRDVGVVLPAQLVAGPGQAVALADGTTVQGIFNLPAALAVVAVSALLVRGINQSARVNTVIVLVKLAVLVLFVVCGIAYVRPENWTPFIPPNTGEFGAFGWSGVLRGAGVIFFAYIGFDAVSTAAQEAKNPQRDMPIGMLGSLGFCTVLYILMALVMTGLAHYTELNVPHPVDVALAKAGPGLAWLNYLVDIGAIAGLASVVLVMLMGQPRIFYAMSRDGLLPAVFGKVHPRFKTPYVTTIVTGLVAAVVAGFFPIGLLGELVSIGTLFAFVIVSAGILVLRYRRPELPRPFRTPLVPVVPILGILICGYLMYGLPPDTWIRLIVWLIIGLAIYFLYGRTHSRVGRGLEPPDPRIVPR
jgi:APA family basic amino acid/polyamine antiporter